MQTSPITQLINFLHLPPSQSSINLINSIQHFHKQQFTYYYIHHNHQILIIYSFNHFKTLSNPITTILTYHNSLP